MKAATRPAVVTLSALQQTPKVVYAREQINAWPLVGAGAFLEQSRSDGEIDECSAVGHSAKAAALEYLTTHYPNDGARLAALATVLDTAGAHGSDLLQSYTDIVFTFGLLYGMRLANYAAPR